MIDLCSIALADVVHLDVEGLVVAKGGHQVAVCVPARDEAPTVGAVVEVLDQLRAAGLVDEVIVVDDGSSDQTGEQAAAAGATVVRNVGRPGKGQALTRAVASTEADLLVFLDADVTNFSAGFVTGLLRPLLARESVQLVKASYRRPLHGQPGEGGRVTELLARPLLRRFFPELATITQPLAGECAVRRQALAGVPLADGYGIEIGLLIDIYRRFGLGAIAEAELGERVHRNRPLRQLQPHSDEVLAAVLDRVEAGEQRRPA